MDIKQARFNMIEQQIRTWEVLNQNLLGLFNTIHREDFIPDEYYNLAFADTHIPIGHNQITMTPKLEARLLQSLNLKGDESVLEIGTGCAYLTALLASSAKSVKSIDCFSSFIETAQVKMLKNGLNNVELECTDIYSNFNQSMRYDIIVLTGSLPKMDNRFLNLLNNNGKMFVIIGKSPIMDAYLITVQDGKHYAYESLFETDLPALIGAEQQEIFEF